MQAAEWIIVAGILFFLCTCVALLDIARKDFGGIEKKAIWAFVCMVPFIGVLVYLAVGFRRGQSRRDGDPRNLS
jgi:uncharacterized membrane protein YhaH (DUF805 family)